jgi:hypothetical protein
MPINNPRKCRNSPRTNRNAYPLRRIVGGSYGDPARGEFKSLWYEELECGHRQTVVTDIIGETHAARRRCRKCYQAAQGT